MVAGETEPALLADLARGKLRKKIPQLIEALRGVMSDAQRWLLGEQLDYITELDGKIARLDQKVEELTRRFAHLIEKLCEIPGVGRRVAEVILAEIGSDMTRFPTSKHLASWAAMCPGQHESAGKHKSGRTRHGNDWLKSALVEAAWAVSHTKDTYLRAQYRNIARRRGKKRACLAVAHTILAIAYHLLKDPERRYADLGADYFEHTDKQRLAQNLIRRITKLGFNVTVEWNAA